MEIKELEYSLDIIRGDQGVRLSARAVVNDDALPEQAFEELREWVEHQLRTEGEVENLVEKKRLLESELAGVVLAWQHMAAGLEKTKELLKVHGVELPELSSAFD